MSTYIDGFVIPLRKDKIEEYREIARKAGDIWREHGALEYYEFIGDDLDVPDMVSFPQLTNIGPDETVIFSWILYRSKEHRDEVNAKVFADPRLTESMNPENSPFDCKRMSCGGFKLLVKA